MEAVTLMSTLFGDDFRAEEARFAAAMPASERALQSPGTRTGDFPRRS
jgi:hypothetical protein